MNEHEREALAETIRPVLARGDYRMTQHGGLPYADQAWLVAAEILAAGYRRQPEPREVTTECARCGARILAEGNDPRNDAMAVCGRCAFDLGKESATDEAKPRDVTTVEELDALPVGSVILSATDGESVVARKPPTDVFPFAIDHYWELVGSELGAGAEDLLPARILYTPNAEATP